MSLRRIVFGTEAQARAALLQINAALGYPRTVDASATPGWRVYRGGQHTVHETSYSIVTRGPDARNFGISIDETTRTALMQQGLVLQTPVELDRAWVVLDDSDELLVSDHTG